MIDERKWEYVVHGSPALRKAICEREPMYFAMYYFPEYFTFKIPPFHFDLYQDCKDLSNGTLDEVMWCVFRDGAKTSITKIALVVWWICFKKKRFINWDSYDSDNSEAALFDVTVALQTNLRIISDFGHLFFKKTNRQAYSEAKMKRIKNFITENGVRVSAYTTQESTRGRLFANIRPDAFIFDDFENTITKESIPITQKIIAHIDELRAGLPAGASVLYLCNFLSDSGSVAHVMENLKNNPRATVRFIPVIGQRNTVAWPDKYVLTNSEAVEVNKIIPDPKLHKISLEAKRASLGDSVFETELMLNPSKSGDLFFDRDKVNKAIENAKESIENSAGLKIWERFNPQHRYGGGADTAEGIGGDSNASAWIDFTRKPNLVVATFEDPHLSNTSFGWELKRQGGIYGLPMLVVEINQTGYGTIAELINSEYPLIYQREVKNKVTQKVQKDFGWKATVGTVFQVLGEFKEAFESGDLEILDVTLLTEMKFFTKVAARMINREKGVTRHFDKLRGAVLAWEARKWAPLPDVIRKKAYVVPGQDQPYKP